MSNRVVDWILSDASRTLGDEAAARNKPTLDQTYAVYLTFFVPLRGGSTMLVGPLADFVEVMRQNEKTQLYDDEEWITFFRPFYGGDEDRARDAYDGFVCQPDYVL